MSARGITIDSNFEISAKSGHNIDANGVVLAENHLLKHTACADHENASRPSSKARGHAKIRVYVVWPEPDSAITATAPAARAIDGQ